MTLEQTVPNQKSHDVAFAEATKKLRALLSGENLHTEELEKLRLRCHRELYNPIYVMDLVANAKSRLSKKGSDAKVDWKTLELGLMCPTPFNWKERKPFAEGASQIKDKAVELLTGWGDTEVYLNMSSGEERFYDQEGLFRTIGIIVNLFAQASSTPIKNAIDEVVENFSKTPIAEGANLNNLRTALLREFKQFNDTGEILNDVRDNTLGSPESEAPGKVYLITRVYRKIQNGVLPEKDQKSLEGKIDDLKNLTKALKGTYEIIVASTEDLPQSGRTILETSGHKTVYADTTAADPSNSSLLNTAMESALAETERFLIISLSLAHDEEGAEEKKSDIAARQIVTLDSLFKYWKRKSDRKLVMAGSLILGEQNLDLIQEAISPDGKRNIDLDNLGVAFPNFSLAMIRKGIHISEDTDNGKLGKVWFKNEQKEEIVRVGGNEDFYAGFKHMLEGEDVALLIDPYMPGERHDKVIIEDAKYRRRLDVFKIYATEIIIQAIEQGKVPDLHIPDLTLNLIEKIVEETIDQHLFYVKINSEGNPEILLTRRQLSKKMESPVSS